MQRVECGRDRLRDGRLRHAQYDRRVSAWGRTRVLPASCKRCGQRHHNVACERQRDVRWGQGGTASCCGVHTGGIGSGSRGGQGPDNAGQQPVGDVRLRRLNPGHVHGCARLPRCQPPPRKRCLVLEWCYNIRSCRHRGLPGGLQADGLPLPLGEVALRGATRMAAAPHCACMWCRRPLLSAGPLLHGMLQSAVLKHAVLDLLGALVYAVTRRRFLSLAQSGRPRGVQQLSAHPVESRHAPLLSLGAQGVGGVADDFGDRGLQHTVSQCSIHPVQKGKPHIVLGFVVLRDMRRVGENNLHSLIQGAHDNGGHPSLDELFAQRL
mmetsp:Transcript_100580/g.290506  ORF Transcript_100580/g.290506 Transcript_100580/m.290506 type:complete len:323 (-) Transcript_100580:94-1062(-)